MDKKIIDALERFKKSLKDLGFHVDKMILFESYAQRSQREDVDVVVISDNFNNMSLFKRLEIIGIAKAKIMEPIEQLGIQKRSIQGKEKAHLLRMKLNQKG